MSARARANDFDRRDSLSELNACAQVIRSREEDADLFDARLFHRQRAASAVAVLALSVSGCSVFVSGPPAGHDRMEWFVCTESWVLPSLDLVWAGWLGAVVYHNQHDDNLRNDPGIADWAILGVFTSAGVYGSVQVTRCRSAKEALTARQDSVAAAFRAAAVGDTLVQDRPPGVTAPGQPGGWH